MTPTKTNIRYCEYEKCGKRLPPDEPGRRGRKRKYCDSTCQLAQWKLGQTTKVSKKKTKRVAPVPAAAADGTSLSASEKLAARSRALTALKHRYPDDFNKLYKRELKRAGRSS